MPGNNKDDVNVLHLSSKAYVVLNPTAYMNCKRGTCRLETNKFEPGTLHTDTGVYFNKVHDDANRHNTSDFDIPFGDGRRDVCYLCD